MKIGMQKNSLYSLSEEEFRDRMKTFCESNPDKVQIRECAENRFLLKYKKKVFFKNQWTPEILECRGTLVDKDFNVHQRPFTKIFNLGEQNTTIHRDEPVVASRKINGFMAAGSIDSETKELVISTTGTTDSSYAALAREYLEPKRDAFSEDETLIFEIVDQERDPHVIEEVNGAYLLGVRQKVWNDRNDYSKPFILKWISEDFDFRLPTIQTYERFGDLVNESKNVTHEGFVVRMLNAPYTELKLKSPFYSTVKWIGRMRNEHLNDILVRNRPVHKHFDWRFISVFDIIKKNSEGFMRMNEQQRFAFLREQLIEMM